jgi:riboflavin kinase/FMN adenylyltransferase
VQVVHEGEALPELEASVVALGSFDGVHLGHAQVLREGRAAADAAGEAFVVVLDVRPGAEHRLSSLEQRLTVLERAGVDLTWVVPEASTLAPREVFEPLGAVALVTCEGAVPAGADSVKVLTVSPVLGDDGTAVSAERIRGLVLDGDVQSAAALLGRPYELDGVVEHGDGRGRTIGFPTANVAVAADRALPKDGVYAGWYVGRDGQARPSAINIGRRPTFYDENAVRLVEAHLLDFDGDLYGQAAGVRFARRLRDEVRFDGLDALKAQLARDVTTTRELLGSGTGS